MNLSKNFHLDEFRCRCGCREVIVDYRLIIALQTIRDGLGKPLRITSGFRCSEHNRNVGGAVGSYHVKGMAADVSGATLTQIVQLAKQIPYVNGIGLDTERGFVHIDVRNSQRQEWIYKGGEVVST